ncbi:sigma factor-like helix-turn-helix DNA-binding protein [Variovorax sp. J31P179]|uniref:sigma factor-like helix-turn-helix DNA-binding protein n=1 Tax=Variovorax sp. J31P179 TaxID=3053508 RepID=UPI002578D679|nr:sigma factor-like helix-turn-helix DNA-binding protein [Variovorax sp. J31P179]MDM0083163.1 sigma factor-like helix-turn-helix DNA-binding protein [Variovorax sp. J31P179]
MLMRAGHHPAHGLEVACSFSEIAAELNISKQRAAQIEEQALAKLRVLLAQRGYVIDDLIDTGMQADHQPARARMAR